MPLLKIHCLLFIVLTALTLGLHQQFPQYEAIGADILTNEWVTQVPENGRVEITENGLMLHSTAEQINVGAYQYIPWQQPGTLLKLSAEIRSADVKLGQKPWQRARLILAQHNGKKDDWSLPHTAAALSGSHDWEKHQHIFTVAPETQKIKVMAQLSQVSGFFELRSIRLYPVSESPLYSAVRNTVLGAWGGFFLFLLGSCLSMRKASIAARVLLVFLILAIVAGTSMPGEIKQEVSEDVMTQISVGSGQFVTHIPWDLSKVWHFGFFLLLGMMLGWVMAGTSLFSIMIVALMIAGGTELAQIYIDGRTPLLTDFFLDALGSLLGLFLIRMLKI